MTTVDTIAEATDNLKYAKKVVLLKQKLIGDFIKYDMKLSVLLENINDTSVQERIDKYYEKISCEDCLDEYGE